MHKPEALDNGTPGSGLRLRIPDLTTFGGKAEIRAAVLIPFCLETGWTHHSRNILVDGRQFLTVQARGGHRRDTLKSRLACRGKLCMRLTVSLPGKMNNFTV